MVGFKRLTPCLMRREKKLLIILGFCHKSQRIMPHILTQATPLATRLLRRFAFRVRLHLLRRVLTHQESEPRFNQFRTQQNKLVFKQWSTLVALSQKHMLYAGRCMSRYKKAYKKGTKQHQKLLCLHAPPLL